MADVDKYNYPRLSTLALYYQAGAIPEQYFNSLDPNLIITPADYQKIAVNLPELEPQSIVKIASDFNTLVLPLLLHREPDVYNKVKSCYEHAMSDGVWEAANYLAIMACNDEDDLLAAFAFANIAAVHGCRNAMFNYFAMLWNDNHHNDAVEELKQYASQSLHCKWAMAILLLQGDNLTGNPLKQDHKQAIRLLNEIIAMNDRGDTLELTTDELARMAQRAVSVMRYIVGTNNLGMVGTEFIDYLRRLSDSDNPDWLYNDGVTCILNHLTIDGDLKLHFATVRGVGDESWFYVGEPGGRSNMVDVLQHVTCDEHDEMAAWQMYLLIHANATLPTWWHGGYSHRFYIMAESDLEQINKLTSSDIKRLTRDRILPHVEILDGIARITCCYWDEWNGLMRETTHLDMATKQVASITTENLYYYNCNLLF